MELAWGTQGNACPQERLLQISNRVCSEMKDGRSERGIGLTCEEYIGKMLRVPCSARCNHRNRNSFRHSGGQLAVEADAGAVAVHGRQQNLARAVLFSLARPVDNALTGWRASACGPDFSQVNWGLAALSIDSHDDRLRPAALGNVIN